MVSSLPNCWEINRCGREKGGSKVAELGECVVSVEGMGHSCWALAGTLCGGVVRGTAAQKEGTCLRCSIYADYNRMSGTNGQNVQQAFPEEEAKYNRILKSQMKLTHEGLKEVVGGEGSLDQPKD